MTITKDTSEKGWGKIKRLTVLGPAGGGGEGWKEEYCQKFGLCRDGGQDDGKCQCKAELKFISNLLSQQRKESYEQGKADGMKGKISVVYNDVCKQIEETVLSDYKKGLLLEIEGIRKSAN